MVATMQGITSTARGLETTKQGISGQSHFRRCPRTVQHSPQPRTRLNTIAMRRGRHSLETPSYLVSQASRAPRTTPGGRWDRILRRRCYQRTSNQLSTTTYQRSRSKELFFVESSDPISSYFWCLFYFSSESGSLWESAWDWACRKHTTQVHFWSSRRKRLPRQIHQLYQLQRRRRYSTGTNDPVLSFGSLKQSC